MRTRIQRIVEVGILLVCASACLPSPGWAQAAKGGAAAAAAQTPGGLVPAQPDAEKVREELSTLLHGYPPALRGVLALDPSLLGNQSYLAPYPALLSFLNAHPEVARNPSYYVGEGSINERNQDPATQMVRMWNDVLEAMAVFAGFGLAIGLLVWLIRTLVDYKRWSRLAKVQTDAHTKLFDRFTANEDLLAYIKSPAGAKFLESSPITLDAAPRSLAAPMARILWSVQGGVVLLAGGIGLLMVSGRVDRIASQPLNALGVLGIALGLGFVISAIISFVISQRLGLIEPASRASRIEMPGA